jgi:hypothetical protein
MIFLSDMMRFSHSVFQSPLVLLLCLLVLVSVRFNRNTLLFDRDLADAAYYIGNVEHFRGEAPTYGLRAPFNERLLVTAVAALLPLDPMTAINLVNVVMVLVALFYLDKLLIRLVGVESLRWGGLYLFVVSFPVFYYATIGYVDSGVLAMICMGTYAVYASRALLFLTAVLLGTLAKEGIVLLVLVAMAYAYSTKSRKWLLYALASLMLYGGVWGLVKYWTPNTQGGTPLLYWKPFQQRLAMNLSRPTMYISSLLSFGLPGTLCVVFLIRNGREWLRHWQADLPLWVGFLGGAAMWVYSLLSAYTDGRFFWISTCFPIVLAMMAWRRFGNPFHYQAS